MLLSRVGRVVDTSLEYGTPAHSSGAQQRFYQVRTTRTERVTDPSACCQCRLYSANLVRTDFAASSSRDQFDARDKKQFIWSLCFKSEYDVKRTGNAGSLCLMTV